MSIFDDLCAKLYKKESRMDWSRKFIRAWLDDPELQFISHSLDSLTSVANAWIWKIADLNQRSPTVSSDDIREAFLEVIGGDEITHVKSKKDIERLRAIVGASRA
jgi:hypothetical protein